MKIDCFFACEDHWAEEGARRHARRWLCRPIRDLHNFVQFGHTCGRSVGGWLVESFRPSRFSAAAVFLPSSKLSAADLMIALHSSLSSVRCSQSLCVIST